MSICDVRIDDRLIHGQVCGYWIPRFSLDQIVIVDDAIVHDEMRKTALKFGCPAKTKLSIHSALKTSDLLKRHLDDGKNVMLLCSHPRPILTMVEDGYEIKQVTIGNMSPHDGDALHIKGTTYVTKDDIECFKKLLSHGVNVILQMTPSDQPENLSDFFSRI
ncbi:MAG: PTS mannose/fructose/sorbose transporter subunit IIB [Erysipelotrichia bacterium]|nr:PTS mannose/fructose/sorbose transporter subunit IIB [Erysipelotrichia bacterium]